VPHKHSGNPVLKRVSVFVYYKKEQQNSKLYQ